MAQRCVKPACFEPMTRVQHPLELHEDRIFDIAINGLRGNSRPTALWR